ncbi:MAG TPA: DUF4145 domain-containing protein [Armatimonadetes bacterium]|nr:DUF4145 domain-containing protein [Armatimonadota bacterium]
MSTTVLSVRVRKELKEEAERFGVDFRSVVERALEEEVLRRKVEEFKRVVDRGLEAMGGLSAEDWVRAVRKGREER